MIHATADTNVIVAGLNFPGNPRHILELADLGDLRLAISAAILEEVTDVLQRKKFGWSPAEVAEAIDRLSRVAEQVQPQQTVDVVKDDPDDNRILECAVAAQSDYIISGDKHLLSLRQFGKAIILKPADFLQMMRTKNVHPRHVQH